MTELLQDWVTQQTQARPDAMAVVDGGDHLTYGALDAASNRLAWMLREQGLQSTDRVALMMDKTVAAIISMIGVLKAGGISVPLDTYGAAQRTARVLDKAQPRLILLGSGQGALLRETLARCSGATRPRVGMMQGLDDDATWPDVPIAFSAAELQAMNDHRPPASAKEGDLAHIMFAAESSGEPRGVTITHRNVQSFVRWGVSHLEITANDRHSGHAPLHSPLSLFDVFGTFAAGAQLHLVPQSLSTAAHDLVGFMRERELTQWFSVPSVLASVAGLDALAGTGLKALRRVLWCGEALPTAALRYWMQRLPGARFTNLYGVPGAAIASSHHTLAHCPESDREQIPIGVACGDGELMIADDEGKLVPDGTKGHLYIGGDGLSPGYWQDPVQTRRDFVPLHPAAGAGGVLYRTGDLARRESNGLVYLQGRHDHRRP